MSTKVSTDVGFHPSLFFIQHKSKFSIIQAGSRLCKLKIPGTCGYHIRQDAPSGLLDTSALVFYDSHLSYNTLHSLPQYPYSAFPREHVHTHTHTHTHAHTYIHVTCALGEGKGNSLQYSCLENLMDRGAWWAAVHGVAQSQT